MLLLVLQILFCFLILYISYLWFTLLRARKSLSWIPPASRIPILGSLSEFGPNTETIKDLIRLTSKPKKLCYIEVICYWGIIVKDYDFMEFALTSNVILDKSVNYKYLEGWLGEGLLTSTGTKWKKRRRVITPAFHFSILEQFVEVFESNGKILIEKLKKEAVDKDTVDIYQYVTACALDIITESAMGVSVDTQNNKNQEYFHAVKEMCRIITERSFSSWKCFPSLFYFSEDYRKQRNYIKVLHSFSNSVIETRRKELEQKKHKQQEKSAKDDFERKPKMAFLDLLLNANIDGKPLSQEDIREEVDTFMFEGHDTTSSAISFSLYLLANHPETQKLARDEQKHIFGPDRDRVTTCQDLQDMKYLEIVIKESLRLYPSVPVIARTVTQDVEFKGHTIPKSTLITLFIYGINRDPDFYDSPDEFIPERFLDMQKKPFAYIPFSAGPRNCIGQKFAMLEMKSMISKILRNFELLPTNPPHEMVVCNEAVLKSLNGIKIRLKNHKWELN